MGRRSHINVVRLLILTIATAVFVCHVTVRAVQAQTTEPNSTQTWYMSLQSDRGIGLRYSTDVGRFSGQLWFRWQFSDKRNEFYDVMYWDQLGSGSRLHYQGTFSNCDRYGSNCGETVLYPNTIVFTPRFSSGVAASGSGSTPAFYYEGKELLCSGVNYYVWQVLPIHDELTYLPRIVQGVPKIHIRTIQRYRRTRGRCGDQDWVEDHFFGTVTVSGENTMVFSRGGPGQYADEPNHWDMLVLSIAPIVAEPPRRDDDLVHIWPRSRLTGPSFYPTWTEPQEDWMTGTGR